MLAATRCSLTVAILERGPGVTVLTISVEFIGVEGEFGPRTY